MRDGVIIVGNGGDFHIGSHFLSACRSLGWRSELVDIEQFHASKWMSRVYWRLLGRRDPRASALRRTLVNACDRSQCSWVLVTGRLPINANTVMQLQQKGVRVLNFMTDDPWNPHYRCRWLLEAIRNYDAILSPRHSNLAQIRQLNHGIVEYLPFAYNPSVHQKHTPWDSSEDEGDVLFVGGADANRVEYARAISRSGIGLVLLGGNWDRYPDLARQWRGIGSMEKIMDLCGRCKVTLVLPRHDNRDGHVMRSYESAASRACVLAEKSCDHLKMFGGIQGDLSVFDGIPDMMGKIRYLIRDSEQRLRLRSNAYERVVMQQRNTYEDRLLSIAEYLMRS